MKLLIIDNESQLRSALHLMIRAFCSDNIQIEEAEGVYTGLDKIKSFIPDIVMLDVEMDDGTGFDLMEKIINPSFQLIFVTAHNKYAIDAFKLSAIDFLEKPINPDLLISSIEKAKNQIEHKNLKMQIDFLLQQVNGKHEISKKITLKDIDNVYFIKIIDILYCEAEGTYTRFHLVNNPPILVSKNLKEYESILENFGFIRTHHSFLANPEKIKIFDKSEGGSLMLEGGISIPVSHRKKEAVLSVLEGRVH